MPAISASAPGKIILFGEHAVVYSRPAIAVPVLQVKAKAIVRADPHAKPGTVSIEAPDINLKTHQSELPPSHPLNAAVSGVFSALNLTRPPACKLRITSTIPIAAGMGSGAAVSVAIIRALSAFWGKSLPDEQVSAIAYEVEKIYHGTPSGIDNNVIAFAMPVYFIRGQPIETFRVPQPFTIVIGDTGVESSTATTVGDLRKAWQTNPDHYEHLFDKVAGIVRAARAAIEAGRPEAIGPLMTRNHELLQQMDVSSADLETLVRAAQQAGALGAKLSGGGRGGNMITLVDDQRTSEVVAALREAGATNVIVTRIQERYN